MTTIRPINAERIWRRLCRVPGIGSYLSDWEDCCIWHSFKRSPRFREALKALPELQGTEAVFAFAQSYFASGQRQSEICRFLDAMKTRSPQVICEIGVATGGTHFMLREGIPSATTVVGVDLELKYSVLNKLQYFQRNMKENILLKGSSYAPETFRAVKDGLKGKRLDLVFIDGDHRYEGVKQDYEAYRTLVKDGGIIAFHDIMADYGTRFGKQTNNWSGGVPVFWNEIKDKFVHWEIVDSSDQDGFGIGFLEYRSEIADHP